MELPKVCIAIPASIVVDVPTLQLKTSKIGQVGRAAAIYRVDEIYVYPDYDFRKQEEEIELVTQMLLYMETPQYLRRRLFPLSHILRYAGTLPPLNTPHHPTTSQLAALKDGEYREGVVVTHGTDGSLVDVGVERPLKTRTDIAEGTRATFRIRREGEEVSLELADRSEPPNYWGYRVYGLQVKLGQFLKKREFDLCILTSRSGLSVVKLAKELKSRLQNSKRILVLFGSPREGIRQILSREGLDESVASYTINTVPQQGTLTVRTEEAIHATLAIINALLDLRTDRKTQDS
jgi:predicted SPOUT superfamily RNA methylase MTH1